MYLSVLSGVSGFYQSPHSLINISIWLILFFISVQLCQTPHAKCPRGSCSSVGGVLLARGRREQPQGSDSPRHLHRRPAHLRAQCASLLLSATPRHTRSFRLIHASSIPESLQTERSHRRRRQWSFWLHSAGRVPAMDHGWNSPRPRTVCPCEHNAHRVLRALITNRLRS